MRLSALTRGFTVRGGSGDPEITLVTEDSRCVRPGALFVAVRGTSDDGHGYIRQALERGAAAVLLERTDALPPTSVAHAIVPDARHALATVAARFHGQPAERLRLIGFTGTFGKTTTSDILRALLAASGERPAVMGSLGVRYEQFSDPGNGLTTPSPPQLHAWLRAVESRGADCVIMEVTSHALKLDRVSSLRFAGGLLAAIMPGEHTDFHGRYEDYVSAKRLFLDYVSPDAVLAYDADNRAASELAGESSARSKIGFSLEAERANDGTLRIEDVRLEPDGTTFRVGSCTLRSSLLGRPNVRNVGLALAYALGAGMPLAQTAPVLASLRPLPRRMERFSVAGRTVLDDTSGHPESLGALFEVADILPRERLWIVWAVRGSRGEHVNRSNAFALADLVALQGAQRLFVTASEDEAGSTDRVLGSEIDAVHAAFHLRGCSCDFHADLAGAMREVALLSRPGDLIVLAGAQGMNEGRRLLEAALGPA